MKILEDESGQGAVEYILIFGGVIVIVIIAALYYKNYANGLGEEINKSDVDNINKSLQNISNKFTS